MRPLCWPINLCARHLKYGARVNILMPLPWNWCHQMRTNSWWKLKRQLITPRAWKLQCAIRSRKLNSARPSGTTTLIIFSWEVETIYSYARIGFRSLGGIRINHSAAGALHQYLTLAVCGDQWEFLFKSACCTHAWLISANVNCARRP